MDNEPLFESKKSKLYLLVKFKSSVKLYEKSGVHATAYDHWKGEDDIQVVELSSKDLRHRLLTKDHTFENNININIEGEDMDEDELSGKIEEEVVEPLCQAAKVGIFPKLTGQFS